MKVKFLILLSLILFFSFSSIDPLPLPSNNKYYKFKNLTLDKIGKKGNFIHKKNSKQSLKINKILNFNIKLTGIVKSGNKLYAIIDGNTYGVGDKIKGFIIKKIMINKIIFESKDGKEQTILLENY